MSKFYVYGLYELKENDIFHNCFYIGKGTGRRKSMHYFDSSPKNPYLKNKLLKLKKSNRDVESKIIKDGLSEEEAFDLEYLLINELYNNLTNINANWGLGAPSGKNNPKYWSDKNRSKETKNKISQSLKNRKLSKSHKTNISESLDNNKRGAFLSKEEVSEIKYLLLNTDILHKEIAEEYNVKQPTISNINTGKSWSQMEPKDQL